MRIIIWRGLWRWGASNESGNRKRPYKQCACKALISLVGARGFEPPTTCTPCRYATRLRYAPKGRIIAAFAVPGIRKRGTPLPALVVRFSERWNTLRGGRARGCRAVATFAVHRGQCVMLQPVARAVDGESLLI